MDSWRRHHILSSHSSWHRVLNSDHNEAGRSDDLAPHGVTAASHVLGTDDEEVDDVDSLSP